MSSDRLVWALRKPTFGSTMKALMFVVRTLILLTFTLKIKGESLRLVRRTLYLLWKSLRSIFRGTTYSIPQTYLFIIFKVNDKNHHGKSFDVLNAVISALHSDVEIKILVAEALGKLEPCYFTLIYQPLCRGLFVVYFDDKKFSFFDKKGFVPALVADASDEHPSLSFSVVEGPETYWFHLVEISTISLVYSVLVNQSYADCVLTAILNHSHLANCFFSIDIYRLFADDLMEITIVLDFLYSQVAYLKFWTVEVVLTPEITVLC